MGFRLRADGFADGRFTTRWGMSRGDGGCGGAIAAAFLLLVASMLIVPLAVLPLWVINEIRQWTSRKQSGGFRYTDEEHARMAAALLYRRTAQVEAEAVEQQALQLGVRTRDDGHYDRRSAQAHALENARAEARSKMSAADADRHALRVALLERYSTWAERQPRVWALRAIVVVWSFIAIVNGSAFAVVLREARRIGAPDCDYIALVATTMALGLVAIAAGLIGHGVGSLVSTLSFPSDLAQDEFVRGARDSAAFVRAPGGIVIGLLLLLWMLSPLRRAREEHSTAASAAPSATTSSTTRGTYCGDFAHAPTTQKPTAEWTTYRCVSPGWRSACLARSEYTDNPAMGCPGSDMCCPP